MNQFMQNLRRKIAGKMQGRYGADQFSAFLMKAALVCMVLSWLDALSFLYAWGILWIGIALFRMLSRKFEKRRAENTAFLQLNYKFHTALSEYKVRWKERKKYKYFKCKGCKKLLRVPRGRGKLNVTCPKCGQKMVQKS